MATSPSLADRHTELFVTGLKNAHAMEKQALSIMTPQVRRIEHYPEVAERLREHIVETNAQIDRLDEVLRSLDAEASMVKDLTESTAGTFAAAAHSLAGDEILKDSFANYAFEHFEIASYKSLLTIAEHGDFARFSSSLLQNLREEEAMAQWIEEALPAVTRRYRDLYVQEGSTEAKA